MASEAPRPPCERDVNITNVTNEPGMYRTFRQWFEDNTTARFGSYKRVQLIKQPNPRLVNSTTTAYLELEDTSLHTELIVFFEHQFHQPGAGGPEVYWWGQWMRFQLNPEPRRPRALMANRTVLLPPVASKPLSPPASEPSESHYHRPLTKEQRLAALCRRLRIGYPYVTS